MLTAARKPLSLTRAHILLALAAGLTCWLSVSRVHPAGASNEWSFDDAERVHAAALQSGSISYPAAVALNVGATNLISLPSLQ